MFINITDAFEMLSKDINITYNTKPCQGINGRANLLLPPLYGWAVLQVPAYVEEQPPLGKYIPHTCGNLNKSATSNTQKLVGFEHH